MDENNNNSKALTQTYIHTHTHSQPKNTVKINQNYTDKISKKQSKLHSENIHVHNNNNKVRLTETICTY